MKSGRNRTSVSPKGFFRRAGGIVVAFFQKIGLFFKQLFDRVLGRKPVLTPSSVAVVPKGNPPKEAGSQPTFMTPNLPSTVISRTASQTIPEPAPTETVPENKTPKESARQADQPRAVLSLEEKISRAVKILFPLASEEQRARMNKETESLELKYKVLNEIGKEIRQALKRQFFEKLEESRGLVLACEAINEKYHFQNDDQGLKRVKGRVDSIDVLFDKAEDHTPKHYRYRLANLKRDIAYTTALLADLKARAAQIDEKGAVPQGTRRGSR